MINTILSGENAGYYLAGFLVLLIGSISAARLFYKTGKPWIAAFVPGWNVLIVMDIVGRPRAHAAFFLIPFYNVYFYFLICIELAQAFGKSSKMDAFISCALNILYVVNLALDYNEEYSGPIYNSAKWEVNP
ncbi:MAG: DUF5684 domain-containing protein [Flavobacteriales bacterium]